jgi:hypothetical protein
LAFCLPVYIGKTFLASLVVEEARKVPQSNVVFFYCKYRDPRRNTFLAIAKGILAQMVAQNKDLLPELYEKVSMTGGTSLSTPDLAKDLLEMALRNRKRVYVVLDGLDECEREDRKEITIWFRRLVESLPAAEEDDIRCLFTSQDDGIARKDFASLPAYKITKLDNQRDIEAFCMAWARRIQEQFDLKDEKRTYISNTIAKRAEGETS